MKVYCGGEPYFESDDGGGYFDTDAVTNVRVFATAEAQAAWAKRWTRENLRILIEMGDVGRYVRNSQTPVLGSRLCELLLEDPTDDTVHWGPYRTGLTAEELDEVAELMPRLKAVTWGAEVEGADERTA